jgi:hypothetical protein
MGIQLYIKKSVVQIQEVVESVTHSYNDDGEVEHTFCNSYVTVKGLDVVMRSFGNFLWADANSWGSNREPLMTYIEENNISDKDFYEA